MKRQTPEEVRDQMRDLCLREYASMRGDDAAYVSALTSAAHLCDQISREATRQAMRHAARQCGDLIWSVADAVKAKRAADRETTSGGNVKNRIAYVAPTRTPAIDAAAGMEVTSADGLLNELRNANDGWAITLQRKKKRVSDCTRQA